MTLLLRVLLLRGVCSRGGYGTSTAEVETSPGGIESYLSAPASGNVRGWIWQWQRFNRGSPRGLYRAIGPIEPQRDHVREFNDFSGPLEPHKN